MKNLALVVAGLIFLFMAIAHVVRYAKGWEIVFANHPIPLQWSIYGAIIAGLLTIWMFIAASKK